VIPAAAPAKRKNWIGSMAGTIRIKGDIVAPAGDKRDWEINR
jgi:hypothetical protein